MNDQSLNEWKNKLVFRSWHRGTKEMDLILGKFAQSYVPNFDQTQLDIYAALLEENDLDLYQAFVQDSPTFTTENSEINKMILIIREFVQENGAVYQ